jgi:hypothetical protein
MAIAVLDIARANLRFIRAIATFGLDKTCGPSDAAQHVLELVRVSLGERRVIAGRPMPRVDAWESHRPHVIRRYGFRE